LDFSEEIKFYTLSTTNLLDAKALLENLTVMTSSPVNLLVNGLNNSGSSTLSDGICVKNTFVHVQNAFVSAQVRSRSCEARFVSEFKGTNDCRFVSESKGTNDCPLEAGVCTVMVKNIPCRCSQEEFLDCVHDLGFKGKYGTFHMPGRSNRQNFGYAFLQFWEPVDASKFYDKMSGIRIGGRKSQKRIVVAPADVQSVTGTKKALRRCGVQSV